MRKETSNQFSEGLISDLNPINTPKTALTDNLNGTIITYNGNEFSLQNDRGNYELKNCKLKPNYIPVGIKEHGDILYIVSYNPLDESVEVGSYPSPLQVNEIEAESGELDFGSIIKSELIDGPKTQGYNNYSKLVTKEKYIVFNGEDYKLYPGDMYKLETGSDSPYRYEKFEYFILDEESNTHDITEDIKNPKTVDENGFSYVGWDIPGWITAKARLAKLSSTGLNIRSFYAPEIDENTREVYYDFILRLNIDDELLKERIFVDSIYQREVKFVIEISGEKPKIIDSCELSEWYSDNKIIWKSISGNMTAGKNDVITVKMTPILTEKHKDGEYTIVYDNLKQEQEFDLSRVNDKPWNAGESLYKYYVSSDKTEQRIEFIVDGPKVSSSQVDLQYRIKTIDGDYVIGNSNSWDAFSDYYGIGNNYVSIPFTEEFKKENIYILEWRFFGIDGYTRNLPSRLLITTELLTGAEKESVYDRDITMDYLIEEYLNRLDVDIDAQLIFKNKTKVYKEVDDWAINFFEDKNFNTFIKEGIVPEKTNITFCEDISYDITSSISVINELENMWKNIIKYELIYNDIILKPVDKIIYKKNKTFECEMIPNGSFNFSNMQHIFKLSEKPCWRINFDIRNGSDYDFEYSCYIMQNNKVVQTVTGGCDEELLPTVYTSMFKFIPSVLGFESDFRIFTTDVSSVLPSYYYNGTEIPLGINKILVFPPIDHIGTSYAIRPGYLKDSWTIGEDSVKTVLESITIIYDRNNTPLTKHSSYYIDNIVEKSNNSKLIGDVKINISENYFKKEIDNVLYTNCLQNNEINKCFNKPFADIEEDWASIDEEINRTVDLVSKQKSASQIKEWTDINNKININTENPSGAYTSELKLEELCKKITTGITSEIELGKKFGLEGSTSSHITIGNPENTPMVNIIDL